MLKLKLSRSQRFLFSLALLMLVVIVPMTGASATTGEIDEFGLFSPTYNMVITDTADLNLLEWGAAAGADTYQIDVYHTSVNTRLGLVVSETINAADRCNEIGCSLVVDFTGADDGYYTWNVTAFNEDTSISAYNGPFQFILRTKEIELLMNGGFELDDDGNAQPNDWRIKRGTGEKMKCNRPGKEIARTGNCAYFFRGSIGERSKLVQKIAPEYQALVGAGKTLVFSANANVKLRADRAVAKVVVVYTDTLIPRSRLKIKLTPTSGYGKFTGTLDVVGEPLRVRVILQNRSAAGRFFVDNVSLTLIDTPVPLTTIALPEASN